MQKVIIINSESSSSLEDLNEMLANNWKVISVSPMGAGGTTSCAYSIVVVENIQINS